MPDFVFDGRTYYNPIEFVLSRLGGLWKMPVLWRLHAQPRRYTEIKNSIGHISDKVLSTQLKELERDGFIARIVHAEVPPRVEYSLTHRGRAAVPLIERVRDYGIALMLEHGIDTAPYR